jgi:hypothetical protein
VRTSLRTSAALFVTAAIALSPRAASAQEPLKVAPPPEAKPMAASPTIANAPAIAKPVEGTTAAVSAGGLFGTGNAKILAGSVSGTYETRFGDWGAAASLVGNYGQGAPAGKPIAVNTENVQLRLRGDRFVADDVAVFLLITSRYDRFQGLDLRQNIDPGARLLLVREAAHATWAELGYDLQLDVRRDEARDVIASDGTTSRLDKTAVQHGVRAFVGRREALRDDVTLSVGVEFLQDATDAERFRVVGEGVCAARISGGLSLGIGATARYERTPLPGKERFDTTSTLSLVYAFSDANR